MNDAGYYANLPTKEFTKEQAYAWVCAFVDACSGRGEDMRLTWLVHTLPGGKWYLQFYPEHPTQTVLAKVLRSLEHKEQKALARLLSPLPELCPYCQTLTHCLATMRGDS